MSGGIIIRTVPNVMQAYGCSAETAQRYVDLRDEGFGVKQARLMAGLSDPPDEPGHLYANEAYRACLYASADANQQRSAAAQIALLHGLKGELVAALQAYVAYDEYINGPDGDSSTDRLQAARAALTKAAPEQQEQSK